MGVRCCRTPGSSGSPVSANNPALKRMTFQPCLSVTVFEWWTNLCKRSGRLGLERLWGRLRPRVSETPTPRWGWFDRCIQVIRPNHTAGTLGHVCTRQVPHGAPLPLFLPPAGTHPRSLSPSRHPAQRELPSALTPDHSRHLDAFPASRLAPLGDYDGTFTGKLEGCATSTSWPLNKIVR